MARFDTTASYADRDLNVDRLAAINRHRIGSTLDIGCGSGAYVLRLPGDVVGIDRQRFPSWRAGRFAVGDAARLPVRRESFDTVLVFETLEHLADPVGALAEYRRVTRSRLLLTVPNCTVPPGMKASNLIFHHWIDPSHVNFWSLDEIADLVGRSGFAVIETTLINRIDLTPFFAEALRLPQRRVSRLLRSAAPYPMTSLVVAEKV